MLCIDNGETNNRNKDDTSDTISEHVELNDDSDDDSFRDDLSQNNSEDVEKNNNSESNDTNA